MNARKKLQWADRYLFTIRGITIVKQGESPKAGVILHWLDKNDRERTSQGGVFSEALDNAIREFEKYHPPAPFFEKLLTKLRLGSFAR